MSSTARYDIVLYGASGFTGQYVLEAFVNSSDFGQLSFAVAGRSEKKLQQTLKHVGELTGWSFDSAIFVKQINKNLLAKDLTQIPIIIADSGNEKQLSEMAKQAKVIVNVVGPYRLYGEAVVKAAVDNGASHVDISGEPAVRFRNFLSIL